MREIDSRAAHEELKANPAAMYIDVRTPGEFDQGHPEGAWNLPVLFAGMLGMRPNTEFVEVASRVISKDVVLIVGCKSGQRSAMACRILEQAGFSNLANVAGGFHGGGATPGWLQLGLPVSTQPAQGRSWDELKSSGT